MLAERVHTNFLLEDTDAAWLVVRGGVDLFAVQRSTGVRRYVASVEQGDAIFGFGTHDEAVLVQAFPSIEADLVPSSPHKLIVKGLAQRWTDRLAATVDIEPRPLASCDDLARFHADILDRFAEIFRADEQAESQRLRAKAETARRQIRRSIAELAQADHGDESARPSDESSEFSEPLTAAVDIVARRMKLAVALPQALPSGSHAHAMEAIARASGFRIRQVTLRGEWWKHDSGPMVGFRGSSPVSLLPASLSTYRLHDPAEQATTPLNREIAAGLDPVAYVLYRPLPCGPVSVRTLLQHSFQGCRADFVRAAVAAVLGAALGMLAPLLTSHLFREVIPSAQRRELWIIIGIQCIAALCSTLLSGAGQVAVYRIQSRAGAQMHTAIWDRLLRLPTRFFRQFTSADIGLRSLSVDQLCQMLSGSLLYSVASSVLTVLQIPLLFYFNSHLAVPALVFLALVSGVMIRIGVLNLRRQRAQKNAQTNLTALTLQLLSGISKIRVAGAEVRAFHQWSGRFARQCAETENVRRVANAAAALRAVLPTIAIGLVVAWLARNGSQAGSTSVAGVAAFMMSFLQLLTAVMLLGTSLIEIGQAVIVFERLKPVLNTAVESPAGDGKPRRTPGRFRGRIEARNVSFSYGRGGPVLDDVSFCIEPGQTVAFVGASGSGKSTLLRLLLGFETPDEGSISYDGQMLSTLDPDVVRRQVGAVLQEGRLISGDIATNILGGSGAGIDAAWEAARLAAVDDDIQAMPMGMQTLLNDGGGLLSGGQRQRILIARALVNRPKILFLDEATSALDNRTQAVVTASIHSLPATKVVIAHRLSTIQSADHIYVLHEGRIVEHGSHHELMERRGKLFELAQRQIA